MEPESRVGKLRILICTPEYVPYGSGVASVVFSIHNELSRRGESVTVVAPRGGEVRVGRIAAWLPGLLGQLWFWYWAVRYSIHHARNYDAVWYHQPVIVRPERLKQIDSAVLLTWHATYHGLYYAHLSFRILYLVPYYFLARVIERLLLVRLSKSKGDFLITAVSPQSVKELRANGLRLTTEVIPNASRFAGIEVVSQADARKQLQRYGIEIGVDDRVVISVGRTTPLKRTMELLRLYRDLRALDTRIKLIIVGGGVLLPAVRSEAKRIPGVFAPGYVPDKDLPTFYRASDLYLSLSSHEAFNLTAVEAATFGLPVALSDIEAHRWLLQSGRVRGIIITNLVATSDIAKLLEASKREPNWETSTGFTWESVVNSYLELISQGVHRWQLSQQPKSSPLILERERKKILFIHGASSPTTGGSWPRIELFTRRLADEGHRVYLVGVTSKAPIQNSLGGVVVLNIVPHAGVKYVTIRQLFVSVWNLFAAILASAGLIASLRPDAIVLESAIPVEPLLGSAIACRLLRRKYIIDYQDQWEKYLFTSAKSSSASNVMNLVVRVATNLYNGAQKVVAITPRFYEDLAHRGVHNLELIPNGSDVEVFRPRQKTVEREHLLLPKDSVVLVYVGLIGIYYRLDVVLKAIALLSKQGINNVSLVVAGTGLTADVKSMLSLATSSGLGSRLRYVGMLQSGEQVARLIAASDIGLIPLDSNPLWVAAHPTKYFEYAACGLPVIACVVSGSLLQGMIEQNKTGIVCEPLDPEALASAIRTLCEDAPLREEMGENGRKYVVQNYNLSKSFELFRKILLP